MRSWLTVTLALSIVFISACVTNPDYSSRFRFPIMEGNIDEGRQAFLDLGCHQCHAVNGVDLPAYPGDTPLMLELGGEILYVKTYADLLTSIINPGHIISDKYISTLRQGERIPLVSPMPYRDQMTVAQLVDLVTFLNSRYVPLEQYEPY